MKGVIGVTMVKLVTDNSDQISILEWELIRNNIDYTIVKCSRHNITKSYLIVDGIPLDFERSLKWIKEKSNNG